MKPIIRTLLKTSLV